MVVIKAGDSVDKGAQIVTIMENGYGKRSSVDEYRLQSRGGSGVKAGVFNEKTGNLVALMQVIDDSDILLIADSGVVIRTPLDDISRLSRVSQGVRIMRLKNDSKIVGVAITAKEDEPEVVDEQDGSSEEIQTEPVMPTDEPIE